MSKKEPLVIPATQDTLRAFMVGFFSGLESAMEQVDDESWAKLSRLRTEQAKEKNWPLDREVVFDVSTLEEG